MSNLRQQWAEAFAAAGMCCLSFDTCAKLLATYYVYGSAHSDFVLNEKLREDAFAAARRFNITGSGTPDPDGVEAIKGYVAELETDLSTQKTGTGGVFSKECRVGWANELMKNYRNERLLV